MKRWLRALIGIAVLATAIPFLAPEALAFPYQEDFGTDHVWSDSPIPHGRMATILDQSRQLVSASPLARGAEGRRIFLTNGGWRWSVLALQSRGAFALTRPLREDLIFNSTDIAGGKVTNGREMGGTRTLASVIAHEKCHGMERRHFSITVDLFKPEWLREGYCDYVAQESSLSDADVALLKSRGESHPALPYYEGRRRVAAELAANGGNVDALFAAH